MFGDALLERVREWRERIAADGFRAALQAQL